MKQMQHSTCASAPCSPLHPAAGATAWDSSSPEPPLRSASPANLGCTAESLAAGARPVRTRQPQSPCALHKHTLRDDAEAQVDDEAADFKSGVRHAGWLWKRFGHGHKAVWKKLWAYLEDDRLCYHQPDPVGATASSTGNSPTAAAWASKSMDFSSSLPVGSGTFGASTAASLAALAVGEVRYIALDRIPVRPLPHRQHDLHPLERSHPDVGISIINDGVVSSRPPKVPPNATFALVTGSHTHYFAAESARAADLWVTVVRETWLHCFSHTARCTGGSRSSLTTTATGVAVSQKLMAENAMLRDSTQELNQQVTQANGEYWRKWVEEKAKVSVLESKLVNTVTYEVVVRTGSHKGAATDARVYMELYGPDALTAAAGAAGPLGAQQLKSPTRTAPPAAAAAAAVSPGSPSCLSGPAESGGEVRLFDADSPVKPFQRGAVDSFTVACYNVGLPAKLKVWHDNTGRCPDWFLMDIKVRKQGTKDWVCFPCNRWLSTQYDDGSISRILVAGSSRPQVSYRVTVNTSDQRGAGTDANVFLQLHGLLGDGRQQQLLGGPTAFDRGSTDEFIIEDSDLGELTAVTISHDGSGTSPAWHLDHIQVAPLPSSPGLGHTTRCSTPNSPNGNSAGGTLPWQPAVGEAADSQWHQLRRASLGSPTATGRGSAGPQQLGRTTSRNSSPAPFSQARAGLNGAVYLFPCGEWLDETLGGGLTKRRLPVASGLTPKVWYTLHITTSDIRGAGTDADVHIALTGSHGTSGVVALTSRPQQFQRGQTDKFRLQLPPLGQLQKLLIGHNNQGQSPSWHLALVEVVDEETGHTTFFAADRWLGAQSDSGLSEVTLTASSSDPRQAQFEYQVCFLTSPTRGSGTDSCVGFELRGSKGSTGPVSVSAAQDSFQRGGSDTFIYKRPHLGQLQQLVVWHDNSGAAGGGRGSWGLEAVVVSCKADGQVVTFPYGGCLSAETQLRVELLPGQGKGTARYRFDIATSGVRGAGTDAAISLELAGPTGTPAGPWVLDRQGAFGRGQVDTFTVEGAALHSLTSLKVTLHATQQSPSWHLDHVVCTVLDSSKDGGSGRKYYFLADRWFESPGATSAVLPASSQLPSKQGGELRPHTVRVFTSGVRGAGTDANIAIKAVGVSGASGWTELPARQSTFQQGQEDVFTVLLPNVGPLTHLGVRSDGRGQHPAWHLAKICVQAQAPVGPVPDTSQGQQQLQHACAPVWFSAQRWLDATRGLEVLLPAQAEDPELNLVPYRVQVFTSDIKHAGTDCRVFLQLTGEAAVGPPVELQEPGSQQAAFQRGCEDTFTLQLPVLGPLKLAAVWLEGRASPWHLDFILMTGPQGDQTFFVCGRWLGSSACSSSAAALPVAPQPATSLSPVELPASSTDPRRALKEYKVVTYTSNLRGAGTDACPYVELIDSSGASSGRKQLLGAAPDAFERGKVDEFRIKCQALGNLVKLRVGHDGRGAHPGWHLSKVEVTDVATGKTWYFAAECWLDATQGDKATERLLLASDRDPWADMTTYKVTVVTSSRPHAGSNPALFVTLYGSKGPPLTSTPNSRNHSSVAAGSASSAAASNQGTTAQGSSQKNIASTGRLELKAAGAGQGTKLLLEPGSSISCVLPAMHSLGQLRQLLLEVEPSGQDKQCPPWHCQHVEVMDTSSKESWLFPCNAWLGSPSVPLPPAPQAAVAAQTAASSKAEASKLLLPAASLDGLLKQLQEEQEQQQRETYRVAVHTSAHSPAQGCVSALVVTLRDAAGGSLGPVRLSKAPQPCFAAGSCEVFEVPSGHKLGQLQQLQVVCELTSPAGAWHLDTIAVTALSTGATTWFFAGRWFDAATGCEALLLGSPHDARAGLTHYKVTTHTSDVEGAGTSAHVSMVLTGAAGSSSSLSLDHPSSISIGGRGSVGGVASGHGCSSNGFGRGEVACFDFSCAKLGELQQVEVWHDSSGPQPAWHLAYVEVAELPSGKVWYFPCNAWLDAKRPDGAVRRTLTATTSFNPDSLLTRYRVRTTTGDVRGAATDSGISLDIHGTLGSTGSKRLNPPGPGGTVPTWERGASHEVTLSGFDVGEMMHVVVALDGRGLLSSWYLEQLEVEHLGTGQLLRFKAARWLDNKRPGCSMQYELWPDAEKEKATCLWELVLYTGQLPGAGTDADVSVELHGTAGDFGPHMLPASVEAFQEGCRDAFSLETLDLGELLTLVISHNGTGRRPAWFLQGVELAHLPSGKRYSWRVSCWLNAQQGCSKVLRAANAQQGPLQQPTAAQLQAAAAAVSSISSISSGGSSCSYQLEVQTADVEGAGTSAAMFVQLGGTLGEAAAVQLTSATGSSGGAAAAQGCTVLFQRGCLDVFLLKGMPDVGPFTHLIIGHDGTGPHPGWCLAWVRVINLTTGARALFAGNNLWLDANRPGCQNWVKLPASPYETQLQPQQQQQQQPSLPPGQLEPRALPVFGGELQQPAAAGGSRFKGWLHGSKHVQPGYTIEFSTSNIWGAGTGSKVFFELIGDNGSSGVVYPTGPRHQFSRGCKASFLYPRLPFVGQLHQLRVGTDGSGLFPGWHLRQIVVTHVHSGQRWLFDCNEWLDRRNTWQLLLPAVKVV